jgi:sarcosine oxidase subunit alpha
MLCANCSGAVINSFPKVHRFLRSIPNGLQSTSLSAAMHPSKPPSNSDAAVRLSVNGESLLVPCGATVAAALLQQGIGTRRSISGEARGPLCAMGICMECCATVNKSAHVRTCQLLVEQDMEIVTE